MIPQRFKSVALSGASNASAALYDQALSNFQCFTGDPVGQLDAALAESPDFVMAHVARAYMHLVGTDPAGVEVAGAAFHAASKLPARADEAAHVTALEQFISGELRAAARTLEDIAIENPHDILALQTGHLTDFLLGRSRMLRDRIARALPAWDEAMPGYHALLGMHAFGLEEMADYAAAEASGRRALEMNPRDSWAQHAVAHVMEMQGRAEDGLKWMLSDPDTWAKDNFFAVHNWWHTALYHLELGEYDQVLALYDGPIFGARSELAFDLIDATAMLWRLQLRGVDVGDRWGAVADNWMKQAPDSGYSFNDWHAALAFANAGRPEGLRAVQTAQSRALASGGDNQAMVREVGQPLVEAVTALRGGDPAGAVSLLREVRHVAQRFGGSHAQRDLIDLTLIEAARQSGQSALAQALVAERRVLKPHSRSVAQLAGRVGAFVQ